jgi:Rieske Fe-S protein
MTNTPLPSSDISDDEEQPAQTISRRRFLEAGAWACAGVAGLTLAGISSRFIVGNAMESVAPQWVEVGEVANLIAGQMNQATFSLSEKDAWRTVDHKGVVYAFSEDGADYVVLDGTCTHLGCNVHWEADSNQFYCPCHSGYFSRNGDVISGPPPKSLMRLPTKIEEDIRFPLGIGSVAHRYF